MTSQESFKRRVRERMARTGERYGAARRRLIEQADTPSPRAWVSQPELGDAALRDATGRGWNEWCDVLDSWPRRDEGHTAVAAHLKDEHGVDGWWAQTITVGWERITGRRLRHQSPDGTFTAARTRTVRVDAAAVRAALLDESGRADLFPGYDTELRSRPTTKALRVKVGPGTAIIDLASLPDGRVRISVAHEKLPTPDDVAYWKAWWSDWLDAIDER